MAYYILFCSLVKQIFFFQISFSKKEKAFGKFKGTKNYFLSNEEKKKTSNDRNFFNANKQLFF